MKVLTLATQLTIARIFMVPVMVISIERGWPKWVAIAIFAFSILTDLMDGLAARMRGERTPLGSFLDPLADKLMLLSAYTILSVKGPIPTWVVIVVYARDIFVALGWIIVYLLTGRAEVKPSMLGKINAVIQMAVVLFVIARMQGLGYMTSNDELISTAGYYVLSAAALAACVHYVWTGLQGLEDKRV